MKLIDCAGYKLDELYIPPFTLEKGEYITLVFPSPYDEKVYNRVKELFSVEQKLESLKIYQSFSFPEKKIIGTNLFSSPTVKDFLMKYSNLLVSDIQLIANELDISLKDKLSSLGGNIFKILAIKAVSSKSNYIITDTFGLDYMGVLKVYNLLNEILNNGSIIELKFHTFNDTLSFMPSKIVNLETI